MVLSTFWRMGPLLEVLLYVFHYRSRWWWSTALPLRCGSWVHVTCANWPGTLYWWADLSTMYVCRLVYLSTNMLVLGRNQIFTFCCIFRLCCHIQNAVVLNFCWGWGYTCYICLYAVCVSPTLNRSSLLQWFECWDNIEVHTQQFNLYLALPRMY